MVGNEGTLGAAGQHSHRTISAMAGAVRCHTAQNFRNVVIATARPGAGDLIVKFSCMVARVRSAGSMRSGVWDPIAEGVNWESAVLEQGLPPLGKYNIRIGR